MQGSCQPVSCCRVLPNSVLVVPPQPDSPRPSRLSRPANRNGPERASACGLLPAAGPPAPPRQPGQVSSFFTSWQTARHPADPRPTRPSGLVPAIPFVTLAYLTGVFTNYFAGRQIFGDGRGCRVGTAHQNQGLFWDSGRPMVIISRNLRTLPRYSRPGGDPFTGWKPVPLSPLSI